MKTIIFEIKKRFDLILESKTGWGRNEIKSALDQIIIEVLSEQIEK